MFRSPYTTYTKRNYSIWFALGLQAGLLNMGGFLACNAFVSHVTGYATLFGADLSLGKTAHAWTLLLVPVFFLLGAMLSGTLVDLRIRKNQLPLYSTVFGLMSCLLFIISIVGYLNFFGDFGKPLDITKDYILLSALCLICGMQNAAVTTASKAVVRTTHLTGITTDLGIGIVRVLARSGSSSHENNDEIQANLMRAGIITSFVFGSILGAFTFLKYQYWGFLVPTVISGTLFVSLLQNKPKNP